MRQMRELLAPAYAEANTNPQVKQQYDQAMKNWSGIVTSIFMVGWASGGLFFGMLGDRIGRSRTMLLTVLLYSGCTGLSALSTTVWDFALYRFLTGLGVGGEFAVGVNPGDTVENQQPTINIVLDEKTSQGEFVNFANIIHSPAEFIIDLGRIMPGRTDVKVYSRVIMTPLHVKQMLQALAQNVAMYEQKYGEIRVDPGAAFPAPASETSN